MGYGDIARRTALYKVLSDKAFNIAKNWKYDGYQCELQWFINFLIKSHQVLVLKVKLSITNNQQKNYTNQLLENLKKQKVYSSFNGNIWGANLAGM